MCTEAGGKGKGGNCEGGGGGKVRDVCGGTCDWCEDRERVEKDLIKLASARQDGIPRTAIRDVLAFVATGSALGAPEIFSGSYGFPITPAAFFLRIDDVMLVFVSIFPLVSSAYR